MVDFLIQVEGVKPDDFTKVTTFKKSVREVNLVALTLEGRVQGVIQPVLFNIHCRLQLRVHRRPIILFLSLEVIPDFFLFTDTYT